MRIEEGRRLISINEAADRYGISRQTVYRMVSSNRIRLIKIGRASRLDLQEADFAFGLGSSPFS